MTKKNILITGITGQDGAYLAKTLLDSGHAVFGGIRRNSVGQQHRLKELGIAERINYLEFDLMDQESIIRSIKDTRPDELYNLAAQSFVNASWNCPAHVSQADGLGALHILEAVRTHSPETRFYQASTSELFGNALVSPQSESTHFKPRNPYGVAKLYAHWMTKNYRDFHGLFATTGILFNHESPLRGSQFVTRKITLALARIALGQQQILELGNLDAQRDWGYAAEYVDGMTSIVRNCKAKDYVLATGKSHTIRTFVECVAKMAGFEMEWSGWGEAEEGMDRKTGQKLVRVNPEFFREAEKIQLVGNPAKAKRELGWTSRTSLQNLAELMFKADYDRVSTNSVYF
tara:strand:+ start:3054 stop:4091 length:1038 start_codon:yes stop_codon:yes gene_type:complete